MTYKSAKMKKNIPKIQMRDETHLPHICCNWYNPTLKFEVKIIQNIPLVKLPGCPTSLS